MSSPPHSDRRPITLTKLSEMRALGEPIVMVTAYDHPSAQIVEEAGVDLVLVGDSAAMTVLGYDSTVPVTVDEMLMLTKAVRRGLTVERLCDDLLGCVGLTLATCPRARMLDAPGPDPFRTRFPAPRAAP